MKNNFQKFQKIPLFLSIILLVFSIFVFLFLYTAIQNNNKIAEQAEIAWQTEVNRRDAIQSLDRSLKEIESKRIFLDTHFVQSSDIVPFLDMIEKLAPKVRAKAEVSSVNLAEDNSVLAVEIKVEGSFESIYKFLTLLENSPYELDFSLISMQISNTGEPNNKISEWSATFKVKLLSLLK